MTKCISERGRKLTVVVVVVVVVVVGTVAWGSDLMLGVGYTILLKSNLVSSSSSNLRLMLLTRLTSNRRSLWYQSNIEDGCTVRLPVST